MRIIAKLETIPQVIDGVRLNVPVIVRRRRPHDWQVDLDSLKIARWLGHIDPAETIVFQIFR